MRIPAICALFLVVLPVFAEEKPYEKAASKVDSLFARHWAGQKLKANPAISDETFLRRVYLDLCGRIPTPSESLSFLESGSVEKRRALISELLASEGFVSQSYNFFADLLRYKSHYVNRANVIEAAYSQYLFDSIRKNKPYDQLVRELLTARGYAWENGAIGYYHRDPEMPLDNMAITTRIFLGTRIECAQCHDHPFDKWKQTDFYHLAAFTHSNRELNEAFDGQRQAMRNREESIHKKYQQEKAESPDNGMEALARRTARIAALDNRGVAGIVKGPVGQLFSPIGLRRDDSKDLKLPADYHEKDGRAGQVMAPRALFGPEAVPVSGQDRSEVFARWLTSPENPRFTRVIVNLMWKKMFGAPLTEAVDDLRDDSRAVAPEVEDYLVRLMIELKYDLRAFLEVLANTRVYQSQVLGEEFEPGKHCHFQGPLLRRMTAEQTWDSLVALVNHEPDARDLKRIGREQRRIAVSRMALDAYRHFDGEKLLQMAMDRLASERELESRELKVREELVRLKRAGDREKETELLRQLGRLNRERGEARVMGFIMPMLENLARFKGGVALTPDPLYAANPNPAIMGPETWRKMHLEGYGPAPKTAEQLKAESQAESGRMLALAGRHQVPEKQHAAFLAYCQAVKAEWYRASEMESPAPRGHLLRVMGQSDREFVWNANPNASVPQALALMNGDYITSKWVLSPYSPLMLSIASARDEVQKVRRAYLGVLCRYPTSREIQAWQEQAGKGMGMEDLVYALVNTKQFFFVQ